MESVEAKEFFENNNSQEERKKTRESRTINVNKELRNKEEVLKKESRRKREEEKIIERKAKALSYLDSVNVDKLRDKKTQDLIKEVLKFDVAAEKKELLIKRIRAQNDLSRPMEKIKKIGMDKLPNAVKTHIREAEKLLKRERESYNEADLAKARLIADTLNQTIKEKERIKLSKVMGNNKNNFDYKNAPIGEKLRYELKKKGKDSYEKSNRNFFGSKYA